VRVMLRSTVLPALLQASLGGFVASSGMILASPGASAFNHLLPSPLPPAMKRWVVKQGDTTLPSPFRSQPLNGVHVSGSVGLCESGPDLSKVN
jgi:hypothetical protein